MSYTKHTWTDGELVTAAKMNNIENGIEAASSGGSGGGGLVLTMDNEGALNKTLAEIKSAAESGVVALHESHGQSEDVYDYLINIIESDGSYIVAFCWFDLGEGGVITPTVIAFMCESPDDYPVHINAHE